jgi:predicted enzyme related to lactoylglutathione lyase
MTHRSQIGAIVIDCQDADMEAAMRFWSGALGYEFRPDEKDPRYAGGLVPPGQPQVVLQRVEHPSRVHLDIEADDLEAERARLETLGASLVERHPKGWIVMQAPTGHRFCIIGPGREDFSDRANEWHDEPG